LRHERKKQIYMSPTKRPAAKRKASLGRISVAVEVRASVPQIYLIAKLNHLLLEIKQKKVKNLQKRKR